MPKISVITPVYNAEQYLDDCVKSLCAQSLQDWELLLIDDGSTDRSGEMCDAWAQRDGRIRVLHRENQGPVAARSAGMRAASGGWFCFVDSDDWAEPDLLERLAGTAAREQADLVQAGIRFCRESGCWDRPNPPLSYGSAEIREKVLPDFFENRPGESGILPNLCAKLIRRECVLPNLDCCPAEIRNGEDSLLLAAVLCMCRRAATVGGYCGYDYRENQGSLTHRYTAAYRENIPLYYRAMAAIAARYGFAAQEQIRFAGQKAFAAAIPFALDSRLPWREKRRELMALRAQAADGAAFAAVRQNHPRFTRWAMTLVRLGMPDLPMMLFALRAGKR